jgi:hypothetical protein
VAGSSGEEAPRSHLNSPTVAGAVGAWRHGRAPRSRFTRSATLNGHLLLHCCFVSSCGTRGFRTNPSCRRFPDTASGIARRHFDGRQDTIPKETHRRFSRRCGKALYTRAHLAASAEKHK